MILFVALRVLLATESPLDVQSRTWGLAADTTNRASIGTLHRSIPQSLAPRMLVPSSVCQILQDRAMPYRRTILRAAIARPAKALGRSRQLVSRSSINYV